MSYGHEPDPHYMKPKPGPLDNMYRDTNMFVLVLFGLCCGGIALILSIVALCTSKDPLVKQRATTVIIVSVVMTVVAVVLQIILAVADVAAR